MQGWVMIHRKIMQSNTFSRLTAIQQLIAIYIILNANHTEGYWFDKYKDIEVKLERGQLITSRNKIVNEWFKGDKDVTEQKVRTALTKLERLGFLTMSPTSNYTLIEVLNYNVYQEVKESDNQSSNQVLTKSQPSPNQVVTTNNNVKNVNNDNKRTSSPKLKFETSHFKLAELLFNNMRKNNPQVKKPNLDSWANTIRLMIERDKRKGKDVQDVILFSQNHNFWYKNVLSADKLRIQFDKLYLQMKDDEKVGVTSSKKKGFDINDFDLND